MKILIIRFSSIGDIVLTSPIVRCIKNRFPDAEIHFFTKTQYTDIVNYNPFITKVITLDTSFKKSLTKLKNEEYDLVVDLHKNLRTMRIKLYLQCKWFSYNKLNLQKWLFVNFKLNLLPKKHLVDRYFDGLKKLDIKNDRQGLDFYFPSSFNFDLAKLNIIRNEYVAFSIGGTYSTKRIPEQVAVQLIKRLNLPVLLLGHGKDDEKMATYILDNCHKNVQNLVGKLTILESAFVIKYANSVISGDTGLMHIASAFNKKIQLIWGNTHPSFGMYAYISDTQKQAVTNHEVLLKCRPCSKLGSDTCPRVHFNCMKLQNIDAIVNNCNSVELRQ